VKIIEAPRLKALIEETLKIYPNITMNELQQKLGDAPLSDVRKCIYKMVKDETLHVEGGKKNRTYKVAKKK
jgi:ATP-dependent DNA helicase RecG